MKQLLAMLDEEIREHENFLAFHTIETDGAVKRLDALRSIRAKLAIWKRPESCICSRGGRAITCECRDWPDEQARRILRGLSTDQVSVG